MIGLRSLRRDRRQRDPFVGTPLDREPVPCGWNADGWPLVRDSIGVRPATGGEMIRPHGIATRETLAGLVEQAQAETAQAQAGQQAATMARPPWGPWDQSGNFPEAMRADGERGGWYGWDTTAMDVPPHHDRPYIPGDLGRPDRLSPLTATVRDDLGGCLIFRDAVRSQIVRRDRAQGIGAQGDWRDDWAAALERRTAPVPAPDFRLGEMMHARFAGMLAMHPGLEYAA